MKSGFGAEFPLTYWLHVGAERVGEELRGFTEDAPESMIQHCTPLS